jgi:sugar/nucleoside kinase (ribokinase family)
LTESFVASIGEALAEIMALDPGRGFGEPLRLVGPFPSGAPAIFIDQLARLGGRCGFISRVGADDFGRLIIDRLARDGADVSALETDAELPTGTAFVRYRPDGDRDFVFNIRHSAAGALRLTPSGRAMLARTSHLHVMGSSVNSPAAAELILASVRAVKARGGTISFDPNIRKEIAAPEAIRTALRDILSAADLFMPSGDELYGFTESGEQAGAVRELLARGIGTIVVKKGAEGAALYAAGECISVPAFAVEQIDPTGAGDCFAATFVHGWLAGRPPERTLTLANASGALAVTRRGPMEGTSTLAELEAFIATHAR